MQARVLQWNSAGNHRGPPKFSVTPQSLETDSRRYIPFALPNCREVASSIGPTIVLLGNSVELCPASTISSARSSNCRRTELSFRVSSGECTPIVVPPLVSPLAVARIPAVRAHLEPASQRWTLRLAVTARSNSLPPASSRGPPFVPMIHSAAFRQRTPPPPTHRL